MQGKVRDRKNLNKGKTVGRLTLEMADVRNGDEDVWGRHSGGEGQKWKPTFTVNNRSWMLPVDRVASIGPTGVEAPRVRPRPQS